MKNKLIHKFKKSVFFKILLIFIFAHMLLVLIGVITHKLLLENPHLSKVQKTLTLYSDYLIDELGMPPDENKADSLAERFDIRIAFISPDKQWKSDKQIPDLKQINLPGSDFDPSISAGLYNDWYYLDLQKNGYTYLFGFSTPESARDIDTKYRIMMIIIVAMLIITAIYLAIRIILKPLITLNEGVKQVSAGNLDFAMTTSREDELGQLINSFNNMTIRLKEMLHSRDRLLRDVSHELRSPLTRIKVSLEFLDDPQLKEQIAEEIYLMENMINELLETERLKSKYGSLKKANTDIIKILYEVGEKFQDVKPGIKFLSMPESIRLSLDKERIAILFKNIITNSLKYSDPDGYPVEITVRENNNEVTVEIQDFGEGIPENELPYIFEPFYRIDKSRSRETGGYGLGLNISKNIMEAHNGEIFVSSKQGVGTSVFLTFKKNQSA